LNLSGVVFLHHGFLLWRKVLVDLPFEAFHNGLSLADIAGTGH